MKKIIFKGCGTAIATPFNENGVNYAEFEKDGMFYQVWLEDEQSIEVKLNRMASYNIAGVGAWKLGLERPSVWNVIDLYLHG